MRADCVAADYRRPEPTTRDSFQPAAAVKLISLGGGKLFREYRGGL
jgi:hypothetical protein